MKDLPITIIIESGLMQIAFRNILKNFQPENPIAFKKTVEESLNGRSLPMYLIIESKLIPQPVQFSLEKIKNKNPDSNILIVETSPLDESAWTYAKEVLSRNDSEETINKKLKHFFDNPQSEKTIRSDNTISDREKEIVRLVALGKTNKEIGDTLFISPHTVITHRKNITAKLGIKTIAGLTVYAILNGLIEKEEM
jgi:DNA-binding CsgD family transcriptional regulator